MMLTEAFNVLRTVSKVINNVDSTTGQQKGRNYVEYALVLVIGIGIGMTVQKLSVANNGTKSAPTTTVINNYIEVSDSENEKEDNTDEDKRDNNENEITKT